MHAAGGGRVSAASTLTDLGRDTAARQTGFRAAPSRWEEPASWPHVPADGALASPGTSENTSRGSCGAGPNIPVRTAFAYTPSDARPVGCIAGWTRRSGDGEESAREGREVPFDRPDRAGGGSGPHQLRVVSVEVDPSRCRGVGAVSNLDGVWAPGTQRRGLTRWDRCRGAAPTVVCVGDSITRGTSGHPGHRLTVVGWVEQLAQALANAAGRPASGGFRGLWRHDEWERTGEWVQPTRADPFDVAPFRQALFSSGSSPDILTWNKPTAMTVRGFDLYWFQMPGAGDWQYRVDDGEWHNSGACAALVDDRLHKLCIAEEVSQRVAIRGFDGARPCIAPIAGISTYAESSAHRRALVHNLGCPAARLAMFCRTSAGDPLGLLDDLRPDLVTVLFSNDVLLEDPARFGKELTTLIQRVRVYADVLIIAPYEQRSCRRVDDAMTRSGSDVVRSLSASFRLADVGRRVSGANIPEHTTIVSVTSTESVCLSRAATGACDLGELTIEVRGDSAMQARYRLTSEEVAFSTGCAFLDLYAEWGHGTEAGWDAAQARGFMADDLHPSQLGHDDIGRCVAAMLGNTAAGLKNVAPG